MLEAFDLKAARQFVLKLLGIRRSLKPLQGDGAPDGVTLRASPGRGNARLQAAREFQPDSAACESAIEAQEGKGAEGNAQVRRGIGGDAVERARHHSHHHKLVAAQRDGAAHGAYIAVETALPEGVTEDSRRSAGIFFGILGGQGAAIERGNAQHVEEFRRDHV